MFEAITCDRDLGGSCKDTYPLRLACSLQILTKPYINSANDFTVNKERLTKIRSQIAASRKMAGTFVFDQASLPFRMFNKTE